jgi:hypothetical protein
MEREIMPDYTAEAFYRYLIPGNVFEYLDKAEEKADHCVVSRKMENPHLFDTGRRIAVGGGVKNLFNDEIYMKVP